MIQNLSVLWTIGFVLALSVVLNRELVSQAADLAVGLAGERIRKTITDEDPQRLADRYVQQLKH